MSTPVPPRPTWKVLIFSALLFAVPLTLLQGATLFLGAWTNPGGTWPEFGPFWLVGSAVGAVLCGGLCAFRTTRGIDPFLRERWGARSGALTGCLSLLLGLVVIAFLLVWYINWWIPGLSTQRPPSCGGVAPLSCASPQASARFGLIFLPFGIGFFLAGNAGFLFLALLAGTFAASLRGRKEAMR